MAINNYILYIDFLNQQIYTKEELEEEWEEYLDNNLDISKIEEAAEKMTYQNWESVSIITIAKEKDMIKHIIFDYEKNYDIVRNKEIDVLRDKFLSRFKVFYFKLSGNKLIKVI